MMKKEKNTIPFRTLALKMLGAAFVSALTMAFLVVHKVPNEYYLAVRVIGKPDTKQRYILEETKGGNQPYKETRLVKVISRQKKTKAIKVKEVLTGSTLVKTKYRLYKPLFSWRGK